MKKKTQDQSADNKVIVPDSADAADSNLAKQDPDEFVHENTETDITNIAKHDPDEAIHQEDKIVIPSLPLNEIDVDDLLHKPGIHEEDI